jgi:hypothetical protein
MEYIAFNDELYLKVWVDSAVNTSVYSVYSATAQGKGKVRGGAFYSTTAYGLLYS